MALAAHALADLARHLRRQPVTRGAAHQLQSLVHLALGNQVEKGRLLKLYRESLLQRVVENRIAGGVGEIGEDNGVLVGQWLGLMRAIVKPARDQRRAQQDQKRNPPKLAA